MTKRITIQSGDYILLSDIPNEQVYDTDFYYFVTNATADALTAIVSLVRLDNTAFLGEELSGVLYWLQDEGYVSKHQFKPR